MQNGKAVVARGALALTLAAAAMLAVAAVGQTLKRVVSAPSDPDYPPPYDNSKADQALKAYAEHHPACLLWSNWHKLCSYTGPHGSTFCRIDPEHPVTPSSPFCAEWAANTPTGYVFEQSRQERSSSGRFAMPHKRRQFVKNRPDRPFNGSSVQEMENPSCQVWGTEKADICSEVKDAKLPLCRNTHIKLSAEAAPLVCKKYRPGFVCKENIYYTPFDPRVRVVAKDERRRVPPPPPPLPLYTEVLNRGFVWGLYCMR